MARLANPNFFARVKAGEHNKPLNEFLAKSTQTVRSIYRGKVTYASLVWEAVNWDHFDFVGVDHYRKTKMGERYLEMLTPPFKHGKPVVVTDTGHTTIAGAGEEGMLKSTAGRRRRFQSPRHPHIDGKATPWIIRPLYRSTGGCSPPRARQDLGSYDRST
jgi:hypothetical protein